MTFPGRNSAEAAVTDQTSKRRLRSWGRRQRYSLSSGFGTLLNHRLGTLMTTLVLGLAMALPLGLHVAVKNLQGLDLGREGWGSITVYLELGVGEPEALALAALATGQLDAAIVTVSPERGMVELSEASGFGQTMDLFEESPLPWVLRVTPAIDPEDGLETSVREASSWFQQQENVEFVQVDHKWLQRLGRFIALGRALATALAVFLGIAVVVVVGNTIRLDVSSQSTQISVMNMIGAPDDFIRQPFLYAGLWYGLAGALFALLLLQFVLAWLGTPLEQLADAYGNPLSVRGLTLVEVGILLAGGALLGLLGSWLVVGHHLRAFRVPEPARKQTKIK